jgi:hypothetical protein
MSCLHCAVKGDVMSTSLEFYAAGVTGIELVDEVRAVREAVRKEAKMQPDPRAVGFNLQPGREVRLNVPENERLHLQPATILETTEYGARVSCKAAATGEFRALFTEMIVDNAAGASSSGKHSNVSSNIKPHSANGQHKIDRKQAVESGYTGDVCDVCGGLRLTRNGPCVKCEDCGASGGCG